MRKTILAAVEEAERAVSALAKKEGILFIERAVGLLVECYQKEGKVLLAGNGGSLCDAMHFAEELTGFFREKRKPLPAIALSDPGHLTCVSNDLGFEEVFSRAVEALGQKKDLFIVLTTSGKSTNLVRAIQVAKEKQLTTIAFLGKSGGAIRGQCDLEWIVEGFSFSDRIQEAHMAAIHIIIEHLEKKLFLVQKEQEFTSMIGV